MLRRLVVCAVAAAACSPKSQVQAGLEVDVTVASGVKADCVRVGATPKGGGMQVLSSWAPRKDHLTFGIGAKDALQGDIDVVALGYLGTCDDAAVLNAQSDPVPGTLAAPVGGDVGKVSVTLSAALDDSDGDGYRSKAQGGTDCDDSNPNVHPGAMEICNNFADDDCNGHADCADSVCEGQSCDDGQSCSNNDTCTAGMCVGGGSLCPALLGGCSLTSSCLDDGGCLYGLADAGAPCVDGGTCRADGQCIAAGKEALCDDGIDNDMDGFTDCFDSDCTGATCTDGNACTPGDTCQTDGGCQGQPACTAPPGPCFADAGTCVAGACSYAVVLSNVCSDGNACTLVDACLDDGGCGGSSNVSCSAADDGGCFSTSGTCNPFTGVCDYPVRMGSCDDSNACTANDSCSDAGRCAGVKYTCLSPPECLQGGACQGDGGCSFTDSPPGTACGDGGSCTGAGACVLPLWQYAPSNFDPAAIPDSGIAGNVNVNCPITFDTGNPVAGMWCNNAVITPILLDGGVVLLPMRQLQVSDVLTFIGSRPVILAVFGDATVANGGAIYANTQFGQGGAGGIVLGSPEDLAYCSTRRGSDGLYLGVTAQPIGGGAGGGAYATPGARGGDPSPYNDAGTSVVLDGGGPGGVADSNALLVPLLGGCPGGRGGGGGQPGVPGIGGGAVQISASGNVVVRGIITVSGGGGGHGNGDYTGGGGGGSGGAILLEAAQVALFPGARLTANGGGGGEGAGVGVVAIDGQDGTPDTAIPAGGGSGTAPTGGDGGNGAAGQLGATLGLDGVEGGGGGGGGLGRLRVRGVRCVLDAGVVSASASIACP